MRLFTIEVVSDTGYAPASMNVAAPDAAAAIEKAVSRYEMTYGSGARVKLLKDEGSVVL